jgi:hypothetical protein
MFKYQNPPREIYFQALQVGGGGGGGYMPFACCLVASLEYVGFS